MKTTHLSKSVSMLLGGLLLLAVSGCGGGDGTLPPAKNSGNGGGNRAGSKDCNDVVQLALSSLQPEQYGVADTSGPLTLLDGWNEDCRSDETARIAETMVGERSRELFDEDWLERIEAKEFSELDAGHVRGVIQFRATADAAAARAEDDRERVVNLFEFVVRNVQLVEDDHPLGGLTAFETLLFGQGTARDRAWIFAELLRQLRIDAVVIEPAGERDDADASRPFLVGVLLDGECLLFDPRIGMPIPGPDDDGSSPQVTRPATLADVRADGELLERLDLPETPYPLDDADLDDVRVLVVGTSSLFAPRLAGIHAILTGTTVVDSFDTADGALGFNSLSSRLAPENGPWTADAIGIWDYPERMSLTTTDDMTADRRAAVLARREVFTTPLRGGGRQLLAGRLEQLAGEFGSTEDESGAIADFTKVRDVSQHTSEVHTEAARDALFWNGLCTLSTGDRLAAETALRGYMERAPDARFVPTCHLVLAQGLVRRGSAERAIAELDAIPADAPNRVEVELLKRRWAPGDAPSDGD